MKCSIFKDKNTTAIGYDRDIDYLFDRIITGKSIDRINLVRSAKNKDEADYHKGLLPSVCFSGTFTQRNDNSLVEHSGLAILDFDKFEDDIALNEQMDMLKQDDYIFACWISPSGTGIKALAKIPKCDKDEHKEYYAGLAEHFKCKYFDPSNSNISRICYESYDPDLYLNKDSLIWDIKPIKEDINIGTITPNFPIKSENRIIELLLKWFDKNYSMSSGNRNNNLFKLASALNDFGINKVDAENVLMRFQSTDFTDREINLVIKSAYKNVSNFGTKYFEDDVVKQKIDKYVRQGKTIKEIKKELPDYTEDELENVVEITKENVSIDEFWQYDNKGRISLSHYKYKLFLQERKFFKYYPTGKDEYLFIKIHENLLEETSQDKIKDFVLDYVLNKPDIGTNPFDYLASATKFFKPDYLSFLDSVNIDMKQDSIDKCYLYYKNKVVEVSKDGIKLLDYIDLDGFIWKAQIIDRDYVETDSTECVFSKFIWLIAGKDKHKYNSLRSIIGYLLHSFKTSANNKAIILNDETISENPNGGSGKGIFWNALSYMKKVNSLDGKQFSFNDQFKYQTVSPDCQVLVFDDVKKSFDFESLFSLITEGITLERKGQMAIKLPIYKSPKILITTNYTIGGVGGSFDRRKFEVEFSAHFSANHTPLDEFGHMLFDEWNDLEWHKFDNFMIECSKYYLTNGLIQHQFNNLKERKLIKETCYEFWDWVNDGALPINARIIKGNKKQEFMNEYQDYNKLHTKTFTRWLKAYAFYKGYEFNEGKSQDGHWITLTDNNSVPEIIDEDPF